MNFKSGTDFLQVSAIQAARQSWRDNVKHQTEYNDTFTRLYIISTVKTKW